MKVETGCDYCGEERDDYDRLLEKYDGVLHDLAGASEEIERMRAETDALRAEWERALAAYRERLALYEALAYAARQASHYMRERSGGEFSVARDGLDRALAALAPKEGT